MLPSIISGPNQSEQPYPTWKKECREIILKLIQSGMSKGQGREIFIQSDWLRLLATFYKYNKFVTASEIKKKRHSKERNGDS